jgi:hypothetical protein
MSLPSADAVQAVHSPQGDSESSKSTNTLLKWPVWMRSLFREVADNELYETRAFSILCTAIPPITAGGGGVVYQPPRPQPQSSPFVSENGSESESE